MNSLFHLHLNRTFRKANKHLHINVSRYQGSNYSKVVQTHRTVIFRAKQSYIDNQRWFILNGRILNEILRRKHFSFKSYLIFAFHLLSVWIFSIHFSTKLLKGWKKAYTELWIWWQQSPSIFKRCGTLPLSHFSKPPFLPRI